MVIIPKDKLEATAYYAQDIVQRLRDPANAFQLSLEAADEIERLRDHGKRSAETIADLLEWKAMVETEAETATEFVLAQINSELKSDIKRLNARVEELESELRAMLA